MDIIYRTLEKTGLVHDEGPDKDKGCGPYVQSDRQKAGIYLEYAKKLIDKGETKWAPLENRIPIFIAYWTAYIGYNKKIYFHDDIYSIDSKAKFLPYEIKKYF